MSRTARIVYGFAEGPRHGRRMRHALKTRGYTLVRHVKDADVILAHSGGYLMLPPLRPEQQLVLLDPSYRPAKTPLFCLVSHLVYDIRFLLFSSLWGYWSWKTWWNIWYIVWHPRRQLRMYRRYHTQDFSTITSHPQLTVLQSDDRSWFDDRHYRSRDGRSNITLHFVAADHDDCWRQPNVYLDLAVHDS